MTVAVIGRLWSHLPPETYFAGDLLERKLHWQVILESNSHKLLWLPCWKRIKIVLQSLFWTVNIYIVIKQVVRDFDRTWKYNKTCFFKITHHQYLKLSFEFNRFISFWLTLPMTVNCAVRTSGCTHDSGIVRTDCNLYWPRTADGMLHTVCSTSWRLRLSYAGQIKVLSSTSDEQNTEMMSFPS